MGVFIRRATEWADRVSLRIGTRKLFLLIFLLSLSVRLTYVFGLGTYRTIEGSELILVARSLADHNVFGNPYKIESGPSAYVAPVYPFLLSLIYRVLGHGIAGEIGQEVMCSVVTSIQYGLLPLASLAFGLPLYVGATGGLLGAVLPIRMWMETKGSWENSYAALALIGLFLLTMRHWNRRDLSLRAGALQGLAWGVALLLAPQFFPILPGFLLVGLFSVARKDLAAFIRSSIALGAGAIIALTPWTLRNYYQLGGFVPVRSAFGLHLSMSYPELNRKRSPFLNLEEAKTLNKVGEVQYNREKLRNALSWMASHPKQVLRRTYIRFWAFWFYSNRRMWQFVLASLVILLGFVGWLRRYKTCVTPARLFLSMWVLYPLLYYFMPIDARYGYPIRWTFLLLAPCAFALSSSARRVAGDAEASENASSTATVG